ncbi:MAG: leucine-rich repeat protein, partial [Clostridia bacterium]|nr:leucine-rich repeat protein [Clostridia bacterium]
MTRKGRIVLAIILALVLITTAITAVLIHQVVQTSRLEELRNEALEELERDIGTYDEQSIVLNQTSKANAEELATLLGAELRITKDGRFAKLTLPEGTTIRDVYANDANLEHIEKMAADYQVRISDIEMNEEDATGERLPTRPKYTVSDSDYALQTYLDYLNMQDVWNYYSGWGVTVAVIDTGIDTDHPEFAGRISEYSYNATEDKIVKDWKDESGNYDWSLIEDEQGHGTAVTGVLAASMNGEGIVGIAPSVNIIVIKAECDESGTFKRASDLVFGIYYAIERDVQVVNMSFGTYEPYNPFEAATQLAVDSDIVCVAAAGNDGTSALSWPAADPNVIGVGALAADSWELADYSNYGENVDVVAPGTTYTSLMDGKYGTMNGTSLASPVVAGAIALFMQNNPYIMVEDVTEVLYASSYDLGDLGRDWTYGFGALDMNAFLLEDRGVITFDMLTDELENTEGLFIKGHTLQELPEPERLYAVFDGWYYDDTFTQEYVYYEDKFYDDITLYAKWVNEDDGVPFTYVELEDGTIEIRSYTGRRRFITIPEKIDGKIVSSIGEFAFAGQTRLREVGLPSGLTTIKWYAFKGCSNLVSMYIPENVASIGEYAFVDNIRLSTIAFTGVSRLKTVGNYAFSGCGKLRTIELPAALESINATAFLGDISLYEIKVQAGNAYFTAPDGVLYNATQSTLVAYPAARGRTYSLLEQTIDIADCAFAYARIDEVDLNQAQTIGESAFWGSTLEALFLPDSMVELGQGAFAKNFELSSVHIGSGLTEIADAAFSGCSSLHKIEIPAQVVSIGGDAFRGCGLVSVTFAADSNLQSIGTSSFAFCFIRELSIPASVVSIAGGAFESNPLYQVTFPENSELYTIGKKAFFGCYLPSITLPRKLNSIGSMAFAKTGLETASIPASVTYLGDGAFAYCSSLTDILIETGNTVYHDLNGIVYTLDNVTICAFPAGKNIDTYSLESTVRTIQSYSFAGTVYLRHVNIPEGLSIINEYAFIDCGASTYTLPSTLTNIMGYAFCGNRNLSSVQFPDALVQIAEYAFSECSSLIYVRIPDNVLQIGRYAFAEDWNLREVHFNDTAKIPRLSYGAFAYTGLRSFTVPANVSTMAQGVFVGCPWLSSVTFAENSKLESISAYMFDGCTSLQSITFMPGSKLTSIQAHGLEGMDNLTSVDFGDAKLENIDNFAFRFCYRLSTLNLPATVKNVGRYAFYGCKSLSELSLPESLEHIGSYAFLGTNDLDLYLASETMPAYLDENWDHGIRGYYTGVTNVETVGDYKYAILTSGNIAIIEYLGTDKTVDLTTVNLGAPISVIGGSAFEDSTVEIIVLPETLTSIQAEAFQYASLKSIAIPASVTFIGREAFAYTDIESLTFAENASLATIEQYAFERTDKLTSVAIPASVTTLGTGVFQKSGISSVTFSAGIALEEIPQKAFMGTKLTTVALPDSVKTVNHNAFRDILTLKTVAFGNSDGIRLLSNVFYNTGLESLHIPANVTFIGEYCFVGLENLTAITVDENNPNYKSVDGLLLTKSGRKLVTVPAGRTGSLNVPISVEEIGFGAFENTALDEILFDPNANILTLGYRAFFGAKNLTSIHIPASVVSIDYYAFAYCEKLQTVTFAEGNKLKGIYEGAFCGDINLENITIPDAIVEISDFAFYGCTKITRLPISDTHNLKGIYDYAFAYTSIGGEFTTPETLIDIGPYAFLGTKITKLTIPETNKKDLVIGIGAFEECNQLVEVTLPFIGASYEDEELSWFGYIFGAGASESNQTYIPTSLKAVTFS